LIVIAIAGILLSIAMPVYSSLLERHHLRSAVDIFRRSLYAARMQAIHSQHRICIVNKDGTWQSGWTVFEDLNANCEQSANEPSIIDQNPLPRGIRISATTHANRYISYLPNGQSQQLSGAFQADSIYFCPASKTLVGYRVVIAKGGRIRFEEVPIGSTYCSG
jgi:type IV fimbrial biogenesis protein FimT